MDTIFGLFLLGAIFYFIFKIGSFYFNKPTLEEYIKDNPQCYTGNGIKCVNCGSKSIRNWGALSANSPYRTHICNHCGTHLYRS